MGTLRRSTLMKNLWISVVVAILASCTLCAAEHRASAEQQKWIDASKAELQRSKERIQSIDPTLKAKNIILFIGDGMGPTTVTAARTLKAQLNNELPGPSNLYFENFPFHGAVKTYNTDKLGPDSAGTATAYLCGVKTNLGVLGLDERVGRKDCKTHIENPDTKIKCVAHYAAEAGKSVGLVTTKSITDASPTPVYAVSPERDWQIDSAIPEEERNRGCRDIASQILDANYLNVALGGGFNNFNAEKRLDKRNLPEEWAANLTAGGQKPAFVRSKSELNKVNTAETTHLLGLFAPGDLQYSLQQQNQTDKDEPSLVDMALKAYDIVKNDPDGYFLFIEGAMIDQGHHDNLAKHSLHDVLELERAITEITSKIDMKETLVLVTADHSHVFTFGSYMSRKTFIFDLSDSSVDEEGKPYTNIVYGNGPGFAVDSNGKRPNLTNEKTNDPNYAFESAVKLPYETHSCEEVSVYAKGPQAHLISTLVEQSTVAHLMLYASCLGPHADADHCKQSPTVNPDLERTTTGASMHKAALALPWMLLLAVAVAVRG